MGNDLSVVVCKTANFAEGAAAIVVLPADLLSAGGVSGSFAGAGPSCAGGAQREKGEGLEVVWSS